MQCLGVCDMVQFYIMMIKRGMITVDDVPIKWREEVKVKINADCS